MRTQVKKLGNSLAVRIPRSFALEAGLTPDAPVEMRVVDGSLVVTCVARSGARLAEMLALVDDANLHGEVDDGEAVGTEVW